jgi:hypothetical protein
MMRAMKEDEERRAKATERVQRKLGVAAAASGAAAAGVAAGSGGSGAVAGGGSAAGAPPVEGGGREPGGRCVQHLLWIGWLAAKDWLACSNPDIPCI